MLPLVERCNLRVETTKKIATRLKHLALTRLIRRLEKRPPQKKKARRKLLLVLLYLLLLPTPASGQWSTAKLFLHILF